MTKQDYLKQLKEKPLSESLKAQISALEKEIASLKSSKVEEIVNEPTPPVKGDQQ